VESRRRMRWYVRGLLGEVERKNGWTLAEAAGDTVPEGMQQLLSHAIDDHFDDIDTKTPRAANLVREVSHQLLVTGSLTVEESRGLPRPAHGPFRGGEPWGGCVGCPHGVRALVPVGPLGFPR
jgi:hypothetical protein